MNKNQKHVHIVGICGVATSALAIAFHDKGWKVTGSDKGIYPPVSTNLTGEGIDYYVGWHPENIGTPDIIVAGASGTSLSNPEIIYAKEKNIPLLSFAEALGKYIVKKNSIVITGTWGKTSISAYLSFILMKANMDPSYFTGGISLSHKTGAMSDSDWSVVEGDEYQVAIWDKRPKFVFYSPTHLLITSVSWDHADLYPTKELYFDEFRKLLKNIPNEGKIVACMDDKGVTKILNSKKTITYGKSAEADYYYHSINHTKDGLSFFIRHKGEEFKIQSPMLGRYNVENLTASFTMAHVVGVESKIIIKAIQEFKGIKRRLEKRFEGNTTVMDCHAPTPEKAISVLESIREVYDKKILAVYEPNIGGRQKASAHMYDNAFKDADLVIIPRLTKLKISEEKKKPMEGDELAATISKTHTNVKYIENDETLVKTLVEQAKKGDVIVFLGSHGFRGMIEETISSM